jgi:hypothetical protein
MTYKPPIKKIPPTVIFFFNVKFKLPITLTGRSMTRVSRIMSTMACALSIPGKLSIQLESNLGSNVQKSDTLRVENRTVCSLSQYVIRNAT